MDRERDCDAAEELIDDDRKHPGGSETKERPGQGTDQHGGDASVKASKN
ncbi:hypothetical protein [Methylobacterium sp. Leaf456]|nr:hypothetical protein [Methylobacterium sp. Leaf456]